MIEMKTEEACKKHGCKENMHCFGGNDKTMEHPLCSTVILSLLTDMVKSGNFCKSEAVELIKQLEMVTKT